MVERVRSAKLEPRVRLADKGPCDPVHTLADLRLSANGRPDRVVVKATAWYDLCRCHRVQVGDRAPSLEANPASAGGFPAKFLTVDTEMLKQALEQHKKVCPNG